MKTPNDIINIIKRLLSGKKIKKCNREYNNLFHSYTIIRGLIGLLYINNEFIINFRFSHKLYIRKEIVCFLTDKVTNYCVPKNY